MNQKQFIRDLRKWARSARLTVKVDKKRGKGSHVLVSVGDKRTTVQEDGIGPNAKATLLEQLGLPRDAF